MIILMESLDIIYIVILQKCTHMHTCICINQSIYKGADQYIRNLTHIAAKFEPKLSLHNISYMKSLEKR